MLPCNIQHDSFGTNHFINVSHPGPKSRRVMLARTWKSVQPSMDIPPLTTLTLYKKGFFYQHEIHNFLSAQSEDDLARFLWKSDQWLRRWKVVFFFFFFFFT